MAGHPRITRLTVHQYAWELNDLGFDYNGFNLVYQAGNRLQPQGYVLSATKTHGTGSNYAAN